MATPLSSRSTTGDSAEGLFVSALANCRRSLLRVCVCVRVLQLHKYSCVCNNLVPSILTSSNKLEIMSEVAG